jgi:hypothetical protein
LLLLQALEILVGVVEDIQAAENYVVVNYNGGISDFNNEKSTTNNQFHDIPSNGYFGFFNNCNYDFFFN